MTTPIARTRAQKLGPGTLTIGETGSDLDLSCQMTEVSITWENDESDPVHVLCGGIVPGDDTFTATLEGVAYQDMTEAGIVEFSWSNKGSVVPFLFEPIDGASVVGQVKVLPIDLGGEINVKNTSDLSWPCIGEPVFTAAPADDVTGG